MDREPSLKTVHITVPIVVAIIGLIATIAAAIIGMSGGREQESTKTVELLAEKFDSVDKKMSYEQALQVIYEASQRMKDENKKLTDENMQLKDVLSAVRGQVNTEETNKSIIENARKDSIPKKLSEIFLIDSGGQYEFLKSGVFTDSFGNVYDGAHVFVASYNAFAVYNLNKSYSTFNASIVAAPDTGSGASMTLAIYADDKLIYVQKEYDKRTGKIDFDIDISDVTKLEIATSNQGEYSYGNIYLVDAMVS